MEYISTDQHGVFGETFRTLNNPKFASNLSSNLLENVADDGQVHIALASTWTDGFIENDLGDNPELLAGHVFDVLVKLLLLGVNEDDDELGWVLAVADEVFDFPVDFQSSVSGVD